MSTFKDDLQSFFINFQFEKSRSTVTGNEEKSLNNPCIFRNYFKHITATLYSTNFFNCAKTPNSGLRSRDFDTDYNALVVPLDVINHLVKLAQFQF